MHSPWRGVPALVAGVLAAATVRADVSVTAGATAVGPPTAECGAMLRTTLGFAKDPGFQVGHEVIWGTGVMFVFGVPSGEPHGWRIETEWRSGRWARRSPHAWAEVAVDHPDWRNVVDRCFDLAEWRGTRPRPTK